jgi:hypothetical protein
LSTSMQEMPNWLSLRAVAAPPGPAPMMQMSVFVMCVGGCQIAGQTRNCKILRLQTSSILPLGRDCFWAQNTIGQSAPVFLPQRFREILREILPTT